LSKNWAKGIWGKLVELLGFGPADYEEDEVVARTGPAQVSEEWVEELPHGGKKRGTLVSIPGQQSFKVLVVEPKSFEEVQTIADHLKARRPVILNLESLDKEQAQRILNFLSGSIYALNGESQRVSNGIFFFAPPGIDVTQLTKSSMPGSPKLAVPDQPVTDRRGAPLLPKDPVDPLGFGREGKSREDKPLFFRNKR
jgi:cell division inhibitor SepF